MKILYIGGTGIISSASSELALEQGHDLRAVVDHVIAETKQGID